jgi:hypothetical protein
MSVTAAPISATRALRRLPIWSPSCVVAELLHGDRQRGAPAIRIVLVWHGAPVDRAAAETWIREHVEASGPAEVTHERPWGTVARVPLAGGAAWFKECGRGWEFEAPLTAALGARWPDLVAKVLAYDPDRAWLLLADAGTPIGVQGNPPAAWLQALPPYAELQRGEAAHVEEHLGAGVPDLRVETIPAGFERLLAQALPLDADEVERLRAFAPRLAELAEELATRGIPPSVQHDDLHMNNVYEGSGGLRVLDWGDSSIGDPFASLVVTFRFLEETTRLEPGDPWFARIRDAYLEPWGAAHEDTFELSQRVGIFAHAIAWTRQRDRLPESFRERFDGAFAIILRRALARIER